jgi:signal transduction histidine kinase
LFLLSGSALFGLVSWSINLATELELQRDVDEEMNEVKASAGTLDLPTLRRVVGDYVSKTEDTRYLLQDRAGQVLAGNLPAMAPVPGALLLHRTRKPMLMRGRGKLLPDGYLFVGVEDRETPRLHAAIVRAFVESLAVTFLLAVGGGALASINVLRRVDAIGRTSRDIMAGDLDQLSAGLNAMLDRIQSLMAGLQQVSSDIAHDLRTPLTRMRQRLELAVRRPNDPTELRAALDRSIADVDQILAIFSALLRIAQVQARTRLAGFARVDLSAVLQHLVEAYQPVAAERAQSLLNETGGKLRSGDAAVHGDRDLLTQLAANLIENAIRYSPDGGCIRVEVALVGGQLVLVVSDDGPGVPAAQRDAVRRRFFRLDASRTTPGSGLGLAMVTAIAELHDAQVTMDDNAPGLRLTVRFKRMAKTG